MACEKTEGFGALCMLQGFSYSWHAWQLRLDGFVSSVPELEQKAWCWLLSVWMIRPDWWSLSVKCSLWLCLGVVLPAPCLVPFPPSFITGPAPSSLWFSSTWKGSDPWRLLTLGHGTCPDFCSSACSLNFCLALILICLWTQSPSCCDSYMIALGAHAHKSSLLICKYILLGLR